MAWYAKIENNKVCDVVFLVDNLDESWLSEEFGGFWLKCEEKEEIRNLFPSVGFTYDSTKNRFIPPQPFPSYTLNEDTCLWDSPVPYPTDGQFYQWDETIINWVAVPTE